MRKKITSAKRRRRPATVPRRKPPAGHKPPAGRKPSARHKPSAGRTRALEATLAALAHDIRTPLTGILALSELLVTSGLDERERDWAAAIKSTAEHLAMLASLIVDAARAEAKGLVPRRALFDPRQLAEVLGTSLAARCAGKDLRSELVIAPDLPSGVIGDALRLRGALENLIDNAVKFTDSGRVRLEVDWKKVPRERARLDFALTDSGIGLAGAEIKRLFRPFAQANAQIASRYGGAGLGLASVKRVARAMGGDLTVKSKAGQGSTFRLTVMVDRVSDADAMVAAAGRSAPGGASPARPLHLLCVEDNPYGRVVLNTILTELGHRADFVGTGEAAIETVKGADYDAVLMDVTLPGIGGLEATRRIRALPKAVPVIGVSGRGSAEEEARGRDAGMADYLQKPLSPSSLARALAQVTAS